MYSDKILEIFKNPLNAGGLHGANGIGKFVDDNTGDYTKIYLKIDDNNVITEARFKSMGGVCTIVAGSSICSCLLDCTLEEAKNISVDRIYEVCGKFPIEKEFSATIAINAVKDAIENYYIGLKKQLKVLEKKQGILTSDNKEINESGKKTLKKESEKVAPIVETRREKSAAKAAFDAMFE